MTQGGPPKKRRNMVGVTGSGERGERGGDQACGAEGDENGGWRWMGDGLTGTTRSESELPLWPMDTITKPNPPVLFVTWPISRA